MLIESVFFWLAQLGQLVGFPIHKLDRIERKSPLDSYSTNLDYSKSKSLLISPPINGNCTKNRHLNDNCCKSNSAKRKKLGNEKIKMDNSENPE